MTDQVQHWKDPLRDVFGKASDVRGFTEHSARIVFTPGVRLGEASRQNVPDAAATIWLFDHPRPIAIGDTFMLVSSGDVLKAIRIERRAIAGAALTKVYLS
ncbi:hypothetical protein H5J25_09615 [Sphingomonas aliaeris]|uniref:Uncharacterized protein n=1 Tax=Sphingomonas aliaeris TaxID=2759526 RepID=A0A974NS09_9SPHN|nr:hypothetical protein [Sphingomonas aliaeris]QQV75874.1 hypothetical protein H5J25_09615 [Sphingomonas aliaeris]